MFDQGDLDNMRAPPSGGGPGLLGPFLLGALIVLAFYLGIFS